jgi:uncharacterized hydrophobic protein (TIGR00271 family)
MLAQLTSGVLPDSQRRTSEELTEELDLTAGDTKAKQSAFWAMLLLSAIIATAGVLSDSTATVIGAMIIAPLSTPIMGMALGIAKVNSSTILRSGHFVLFGAIMVIGVGAIFNLVLPGDVDLLANPQISGRTSPGLLDLVAAVACGFAGAIALARRDVAAILPGVAIAISLVPPLAVVGICAGERSWTLALGALLLFLSNLLALVLAGTLVYTALAFDQIPRNPKARRRAYITLAALMFIVTIPLAANTIGNYLLHSWEQTVEDTADEWLSPVSGASVEKVDWVSNQMVVRVQTPSDIPSTDDLMDDLRGKIPNGIPVVVVTSLGQEYDAGVVGRS